MNRLPEPVAGHRSLDEEFLFALSGDDPREVESFLSLHAAHDERFRGLRQEYTALVPGLLAWGSGKESGAMAAGANGPVTVDPPVSIPGYRLIRAIGRGGMGIVYHAEKLFPRRQVALKVILGADGKARERGLREIQAMASLRSPHIVTLYESGIAGGFPYYAMELLEGETLAALIERWGAQRPADRCRRAAEILVSACAAIDLIHSQGMLHRDVKPSNIFITSDGTVKLIDFGLARVLGDEGVTRTGAVMGTVVYMSPEMLLGKRGRLDRRSDVYSLGATLYEAATLRRPFEGEDEAEVLARGRSVEPEAPHQVDPAVPPDLSAVIQKSMEAEPWRRYATAGDLAADLRAFVAGEPVSAAPIGRWGRLQRWIARKRRRLAAVSLVTVLTLLVAAAVGGLRVDVARTRAVEAARSEALTAAEEYRKLQARIPLAVAALEESRAGIPDSATYEQRRPIFQAQRALAELLGRSQDRFQAAILAAQRGLEIHAQNQGLREFLTGFLWERYLLVEAGGTPGEERRLQVQLLSYAPDWAPRFRPSGTVSISSDPPGAQVYIFRYESHEMVLRPVPYHPGRGSLLRPEELPRPVVRVVRPPPPAIAEFGLELGDRVVALDGQPAGISTNRLLAQIEAQEKPARFELAVERGGRQLTLHFTVPQMVESIARHLHDCLETEAFPLEFPEEGRLGATPLGELTLEAGSYLAVLRREGCRDTRVPFVASRDLHRELRVRLFTEEEIGAGFVYVPAGPAVLGGDPAGFFPEPKHEVDLGDFFISRYEVSFAEYLEFLNDPEVRAEIAASPSPGSHFLLPLDFVGRRSEPLYSLSPGDGYRPLALWGSYSRALRWISRHAAERYVRWVEERERKRGGPRTFALPSADQLEKAARGTDGRLFPWGNLFDWSLVSTYRAGSIRDFHFPTDASPYDARNLAGAVAEFTTTDESPPAGDPDSLSAKRMECRIKGGSFLEDLEPFFHIAGHTRERVRDSSDRIGFRLVAWPAKR